METQLLKIIRENSGIIDIPRTAEETNTCPFAKKDASLYRCDFPRKCNYQMDYNYNKYCSKVLK